MLIFTDAYCIRCPQHGRPCRQAGLCEFLAPTRSQKFLVPDSRRRDAYHVTDQAYLLARHQNAFNDVAARIHTMYFLATPHRGSNSAAYLKAYLALSFPTGAKAYVKELLPDSDIVMVCGRTCILPFTAQPLPL